MAVSLASLEVASGMVGALLYLTFPMLFPARVSEKRESAIFMLHTTLG